MARVLAAAEKLAGSAGREPRWPMCAHRSCCSSAWASLHASSSRSRALFSLGTPCGDAHFWAGNRVRLLPADADKP